MREISRTERSRTIGGERNAAGRKERGRERERETERERQRQTETERETYVA